MLAQRLSDYLESVLKDRVDVSVCSGGVVVSDRPDLSDYQCNLPFRLAKFLRKKPLDIAEEIAAILKQSPFGGLLVEVSPPGFVNIKLTQEGVSDLLERKDRFTACVARETIVLDYGGPNVAKPLHVGHVRSAVIGESLKRILKFVGHTVIADVHLGDWGTQMGKIIYGLEQMYPSLYTEVEQVCFEDLEQSYTLANIAFEKEESASRMRALTYALQQHDPLVYKVWERIRDLSVSSIQAVYKRLGVGFDLWYGESRYQDAMPDLCDRLQKQGVAYEDDGALIVDVAKENEEIPPIILRKKDGGFLYATTDLATIQERVEDLKATKVFYVVDARQSLHFDQVFRLARLSGFEGHFELLGFGTVNGEDGKPFKTRDGVAFKLDALLDTMEESVKTCMQEKGREICENVVKSVAVAAIKVADLQQDMRHNYIFSFEKFSSFEGRTGPYLLYVVTRIGSLLKKESVSSLSLNPGVVWTKEERDLAIKLLHFSDIVTTAARNCAPHVVCGYAFDVAASFNAFYQSCPVLKADEETKNHRLALCQYTQDCLRILFDLLGLEVPEYM